MTEEFYEKSFILLSEGFTLTTGMIITIAIVAVVLLILIIFLAQYKRVAPNEIMVISGGGIQPDPVTGSKTKIVSGGGTFVIPVLQEYTYISQNHLQWQVLLQRCQQSIKCQLMLKHWQRFASVNLMPCVELRHNVF